MTTDGGMFAVEPDNGQWMHQDASSHTGDDAAPEVGLTIGDSGSVYFSTPPSRSVVYAATRTKTRDRGAAVRRRIEPFLKAARSTPLTRLEDYNRLG